MEKGFVGAGDEWFWWCEMGGFVVLLGCRKEVVVAVVVYG